MKKDKNIKSYTATELKVKRAESRTDLSRVDAITDAELERLVAEDEDERGISPDWTQAKLVLPQAKQSVHLRLEQEIISFFKSQGKGHISRMQAVLKAYVEAHRSQARRAK
ncbi:MAG: BrnA antitoxin family protein [Desulfobaccales bacterium]